MGVTRHRELSPATGLRKKESASFGSVDFDTQERRSVGVWNHNLHADNMEHPYPGDVRMLPKLLPRSTTQPSWHHANY